MLINLYPFNLLKLKMCKNVQISHYYSKCLQKKAALEYQHSHLHYLVSIQLSLVCKSYPFSTDNFLSDALTYIVRIILSRIYGTYCTTVYIVPCFPVGYFNLGTVTSMMIDHPLQ